MINDPLQNLLREWAQRRECGEQHLQALTTGIMELVSRRPSVVRPVDESAGRNLGLWPRFAYIAIGAAAMLMVILGLNLVRPHTAWPISSPPGLPANYAVVKARVVREMNLLFSGQLRWVTEDNGAVKIGVDSEAGTIESSLASAWIQTVIVTRQAGETTWRPVWSAAVQVRNDEQIELTSPTGANDRLMFWAYAVGKDKWVIDSACVLTTPVRLSSESSTIIETGQYREIAALKTEDRECRVFQTVLNMNPPRNS